MICRRARCPPLCMSVCVLQVPIGEVWSEAAILERKKVLEDAGFTWSVVAPWASKDRVSLCTPSEKVVYVCIYIYIYITSCDCVYEHVDMHMFMRAWVHAGIYIHLNKGVYIYIYISIYTYLYIHIQICMELCVYVHVWACICVYVHVFVCIYIYAYIPMFS